jgi:biotin carboxyl carrier protein
VFAFSPGKIRGGVVARNVIAPVAGQLIARLVREGDAVAADTEVAVVEAMKMHIPVSAELAGRVARWLVDEKSTIAEGEALLLLED